MLSLSVTVTLPMICTAILRPRPPYKPDLLDQLMYHICYTFQLPLVLDFA